MANTFGQEAWSNGLLSGLLDEKSRVFTLYLYTPVPSAARFISWKERGNEVFVTLPEHRYYVLNMELHLNLSSVAVIASSVAVNSTPTYEDVIDIPTTGLTKLDYIWNGFALQHISTAQGQFWVIRDTNNATSITLQEGTLSSMQVLEIAP